jgi:ATP-dependent Lhr-like helicase
LGEADLRELLDARVIALVEEELQRLADGRRARNADEVHDLLRWVGDLTCDEIAERAVEEVDVPGVLAALEGERRVVRVRVRGRDAWIAVEDVALYRDALGVAPPQGVASVFLEEIEDAVTVLLARWARTHGPFSTAEVAERYGLTVAQARLGLEKLEGEERLLRGEFRPQHEGEEWCEPDVLRQIKRRTIAKLRGQVAPVSRETLARFLPAWHRISGDQPHESLEAAIEQLEGLPLSYRELTRLILPARVPEFGTQMLDELGAMGWLVWIGHSPLRNDDGRIQLFRRDRVDKLLLPPDPETAIATIENFDDRHKAILDHLEKRGASFHTELVNAVPDHAPDDVVSAVWDLVWAGLVTNDTLGALRSLQTPVRAISTRTRTRTRPRAGHDGDSRRRRLPRGWWRDGRVTSSRISGPGGRWSLVRDLLRKPATSTERAVSWASTLLERHALVARETAGIEALGGGFSGVYHVLRSMEESGKLRRGYFVEGLGGAQFTYPGVVDRLRRVRDAIVHEHEVVALAATDPANAYGWLLPWPELSGANPQGARRATGAAVVLVDGVPVLYLDRNGRRLRTFVQASSEDVERALPALKTIAQGTARGAIVLDQVGDDSALQSPMLPTLRAAGFKQSYRYLSLSATDA